MTSTSEAYTYSSTTTGNTIVDGPLNEKEIGQSILPARAYVGQEEFDHEQRVIFSQEWIWAGYTHWLENPGDVRPVKVGGRPLLIIKEADDKINVFHNSCRHRGMVLTEEPIDVTQRIQCAYHCWSYNLDGSLAAAPYFNRERRGKPGSEVKSQLHLLPVETAVWAGMIFVNLSENPTPFAEVVSPLTKRWDHVDLTRLHNFAERKFDLEINWKLAVENFLDFYHLPFVHPQVGPVSASLDIDDVVLGDHIIGGCYPRGAVGKAKKTEDQLPNIGDVPADRVESQDIFCIFPNALVFLEADWFQVIALEPVSPTHTIEHMALFCDESATDSRYAAELKQLEEVLFHVNEQDIPFLYKLQQGRYSQGSDHTVLLPHWDQITAMFQKIVAQKTGFSHDG